MKTLLPKWVGDKIISIFWSLPMIKYTTVILAAIMLGLSSCSSEKSNLEKNIEIEKIMTIPNTTLQKVRVTVDTIGYKQRVFDVDVVSGQGRFSDIKSIVFTNSVTTVNNIVSESHASILNTGVSGYVGILGSDYNVESKYKYLVHFWLSDIVKVASEQFMINGTELDLPTISLNTIQTKVWISKSEPAYFKYNNTEVKLALIKERE